VSNGLNQGVWVYGEQKNGRPRNVTYELLGEGRRLANCLGVELSVVVFCIEKSDPLLSSLDQELIAFGADKVFLVQDESLNHFNDLAQAEVLSRMIGEHKPEIVLIGATAYGRSLAPRVAACLGTGLTADCTSLEVDINRRILLQTRPAFGGNLMATITCPEMRPQMATVRPRVMKPLIRDDNRKGVVLHVPMPISQDWGLEVLESVLSHKAHENLLEAETIIGLGRGIGGKANIKYAERLAEILGASLGASRTLVDEGLIDYSHQIGQTGKTVAPRLYIACGISGSVQHIAGMSSAECIIAIDSNPEAPIFRVAHIGIVADLNLFLPALVSALEQRT